MVDKSLNWTGLTIHAPSPPSSEETPPAINSIAATGSGLSITVISAVSEIHGATPTMM